MKALLAIATLWLVGALMVIPSVAADKEDLDHLEKRVNQLNAAAQKPGMMDIALQRISTETGVPVERVREQHKKHPEIGAAGLMIANVLANETQKRPEQFLNQKASGKKWLPIAKENKVTVDKLNERLDRLARAMKG